MSKIKQFFRFQFNRSIVLSPDSLRSKIRFCEKAIFYDFIAMFICAAVVVFSSYKFAIIFNFGLCLFSSWTMLDILQWNRYNNLYVKYYKGGVIFEDPESDKAKDSEKEI